MVPRTYRDTFYKRTTVVTVFLLLFFLAIVLRLGSIQIIHGEENKNLAEAQYTSYQKLPAARGDIKIVDRFSGNVESVATNAKSPLVYAVPPEIENATTTAQALAPVLGMDAADIAGKLSSPDKKYVPIKKQLTDDQVQRIKDLKLPGIAFDAEDIRVYPEHSLLSHVLGFVGYQGDQRAGLYGLERYFNDDLAGREGYVSQEKAVGGAWIFGSRRDMQPAVNGVNLVLTIDKTLQYQAQTVLKDSVTKHEADSGSVIIMNPKTGAIMAMASYPDFDPNTYNKVTDPALFNNQAATGAFEPGSTFKAITMAAAIDAGKITPDTTYEDTGQVVVDNYTIKNAEGGPRGQQTMIQALDYSLNTGAIFAESQLGNADFYKYVKGFGFGAKTGIELPEAAGSLDNLKYGNITVNYYTASFGQGFSATPIQLVQAYSALANNGQMMKPYIVQSKIYPDGRTENASPTPLGQVVSAKTANTVSAMLVDVVENGFGKKAAVPGYYVAGKTGTAQVARKDGKGYEPNDNIGSFIGYGPVNDPQFLMLVRIDHPRDVEFAESTAAPAWGELAQFILNYLHIPPTRK